MSSHDFAWCLEACKGDIDPHMSFVSPTNDPTFGIEVSPPKRRCLPPRQPIGHIPFSMAASKPRRGHHLSSTPSISRRTPMLAWNDSTEIGADESELELERKAYTDCHQIQRSDQSAYWLRPWTADHAPQYEPSHLDTDHQKQWRHQLVNMRGRALAYGPLSRDERAFFSISMDLVALLHAWTELWQRRRAYFSMTDSAHPSMVDSLDGRVCNFGFFEDACDVEDSQLQTELEFRDLSDSNHLPHDQFTKRYIGPYRVLGSPDTEDFRLISPLSPPGGDTSIMSEWQEKSTLCDHSIQTHVRSRSNRFEMMEDVYYELPSLISDRSGFKEYSSLVTLDDCSDDEIYFD